MNIDNIFNQVKNIIKFTEGIKDPKVDIIKNEWQKNKMPFINMFKNQLIYTYPEKIVLEWDEKEKISALNEFIDMIDYTWHNKELASYLYCMKDDFYKNLSSKSFSDDNVFIPKGTKIIKSFKFFEKNKNILEIIQSYASHLIQESKVEGYLSFSVHPLDYLSLSENTYNWRSCHALDGEYRAGNLSYMMDKSTIVCYLSNREEYILPNFPKEIKWNSKKWRMLLFLNSNNSIMFAGRQYPFSVKNILPQISKIFYDIFSIEFNEQWDQCFKSNENKEGKELCLLDKEKIIPLKHLIIDEKGSRHYNDLLKSSSYIPFYTTNDSIKEKIPIFIGSSVPCLRCGEDDIIFSDTLLCSKCEIKYGNSNDESIIYCECCDRRMMVNDATMVYFGHGEYRYICPNCLKTETHVCSSCGQTVYNNMCYYDADQDIYICSECI